MRRIVLFCLCALIGIIAAGCSPQLTDEEKNAPPPSGPRGGYKPPPPGAASSPSRGPGAPSPGAPPMGR